MNIKKMGALLALATAFTALKAKSETSSPDVMRDVFEKPVISAVAAGDMLYTLRPDAALEEKTSSKITINGVEYEGVETTTNSYPIQVQGENIGFAFNFGKGSSFPGLSSMAYNAERDELYFGLNASTSSVFKITNASQQGRMTLAAPKEEKLRNENRDDAGLSSVISPSLISFGDWLLAFQEEQDKLFTCAYHINGVINHRSNISNSIEPKFHTQDDKNLYISNGSTTGKISKENPTSMEIIDSISTVGLATLNGNLYHANGTSIYENGEQKTPTVYNTMIHSNTNTINHIASDGEMLFVAVENELTTPVMSGFVNGTVIRYIEKADKVIPSKNGVHAIRNNQMRFYSNAQLSR